MRKICLVGGTGYVGGHLASRLSAPKRELRVLCRNPGARRDVSAVPGVRVQALDVYDSQALARSFEGADAVINLVGILNESGNNGAGFHRAHVTLLESVIEACNQAGVERFLQMSALNAGKGDSFYQKSKGDAEARLKQSDLDWTIFQPSVIFGPDDSFLNRFADLLKLAPVLPLACPNARFQPVYVGDVADAFALALEQRDTVGRSLELVGPNTYTLRELVSYVRDSLGLRRWIIGLPRWAARLQAAVFDFVPGKPFSSDNFKSLQIDSVSSNNALPGLGISPTPLEAIAPRYLGQGSRAARYQSMRRHAGR
ncbi:MAG: complex I NDUFA9 subunit family protein [Xanthomonadales bacterium]|nr:complex I NDUFA9 subunit family protein [Xanthomonadales bacterium]